MAIPPKGDPRRPLHLAVRSTRLLAIIFLLFGSCAFIPFLIRGAMPMRTGLFLDGGILILYFGPGVVYLVTSIFLKRRQFWAVVVALFMASIQLLFALLASAAFLITSKSQPVDSLFLISASIVLFVILALAQLIYHLALSFEAIKYVPAEEQHGFEPLMGQPIEPQAMPGENEAEK